MWRALFLLVLMVSSGPLHAAAEEGRALVGRWRAETVPTGYWIIDRYPDGRYAEKAFLSYDYSKPSEIVVSWGRWKVSGKMYESIIDGSTSEFVRQFVGTWKNTEIISIRNGRFEFMSSDNYPRFEVPDGTKGKLLSLHMKAPPDLSGSEKKVIKTNLKTVPSWANSTP